MDNNRAIGFANQLPWHLPDDLKFFKAQTQGGVIVMGRKTFESFPKPLPNRTHVIISRQANYQPEGCIVVNSLEQAIEACPKTEEVYIIGGGEIYRQSIAVADKLDLTKVHASFEADTLFPEIDLSQWQLVFEEHHPKDERHDYAFTFQTFTRK